MDPATQALWLAEALALAHLAGPIICTYLLSIGVQLVTQIVVGHVSPDALAAAALATMFAHAFGLSIILGCAAACDTLCSQAFGARNYARAGMVAYQGCFIGLLLVVLVGLSWWNLAPPFFALMGQDEDIAALSVQYLRLLLWGLPATALFETMKKPLLAAGMPLPPLFFSALSLVSATILSVVLVYSTPLGFWGAPIASSISTWFALVSLVLYLRNHRAVHAGLARVLPAVAAAPEAAAAPPGGAGAGAQGARAAWGQEEAAGTGLAAAAAAAGGIDDGAISLACGAEEAVAAAPAPEAAAPAPEAAAPAAETAAPREEDAAHLPYHDLLDIMFPQPTAEIFHWQGVREYLALGAPSALMLMVEWGSYEMLSLSECEGENPIRLSSPSTHEAHKPLSPLLPPFKSRA